MRVRLLRELEEFDRVGEGVRLRRQGVEGVEDHGDENALRVHLFPPDQTKAPALFDPLARDRQDVVVRRDEDPLLFGGVLEDGRVLRLLAEFVVGVLDIPAPISKALG